MGSILTEQIWVNNPYTGEPTRQSTTPAVIWVSRDGRRISSKDPSFDPRTPTGSDFANLRLLREPKIRRHGCYGFWEVRSQSVVLLMHGG